MFMPYIRVFGVILDAIIVKKTSMHIWNTLKESFTNPLKAYEYYFTLPFSQRLKAAVGLTMFTTTAAGILHLMLSDVQLSVVWSLYLYAASIGLVISVGIVFPPKPRYRWIYGLAIVVVGSLYAVFSATWGYSIGKDLASGITVQLSLERLLIGLVVLTGFTFSDSIFRQITRFIANEKARADAEIALAQRIQTLLLPPVRLERTHYTVFAQTEPAAEVGGDYFEVLELPEGKLFVAIGDVSGHNVGAGVLMAMLKSGVRTALQHTHDLAALTTSLNATLLENKEKSMFVSFQCAVIHPAEQTITVVHAGHLPLLHRSQAELQAEQQAEPQAKPNVQVQEHRTPSLALGLSKQAKFTAETISYERGDQFVLLTDGIIEVMNAGREEFGVERVKMLVQAERREPADVAKHLSDEVQRFTAQSRTEDDRTIVVVNV
jgi:serine phosphatase RsbU (regulator of sigma subunit)